MESLDAGKKNLFEEMTEELFSEILRRREGVIEAKAKFNSKLGPNI